MKRTAIVFPGQASQYVGMGKDLYESDAGVRELYRMASDDIGEDIAGLSFEGPADRLKQTRYTQPAILLHSLAVLKIMEDNLPRASLTAGHSLGEYGALALSGALNFEDAVKAVVKRAALMEEACRKNPSTMAAVIGLDESKVTEICEIASASGVVVPANFNSSNQVVISGTIEGVDEASRLCRQHGAKKVVILEVGGAFHSPLMESARKGMEEYLASVELREPGIAVIPNVTGTAESDPARLKELLVKQLTAPVRWSRTMRYFNEHDIDTMIEVGPGKVLTAMARRELKSAQVYNIDTLEDIEKFTAAVAG